MPMRLRKIVIVPGLLFAVMTLLQAEGAGQPKNPVPGDPYPEAFDCSPCPIAPRCTTWGPFLLSPTLKFSTCQVVCGVPSDPMLSSRLGNWGN